jgi:hypothetical protein
MKTYLLLVLYAFGTPFVAGQNQQSPWVVKAYYPFESYSKYDYYEEDLTTDAIFREQLYSLGNFVLALSFTNGKIYQELALSDFGFKRSVYQEIQIEPDHPYTLTSAKIGDETLSADMRILYEIGYNNQSEKKLKPLISAGIEPFFTYFQIEPVLPTNFPVHSMRLGTTIYLIPRVIFELNSKLFIDLNVPFGIFKAYWNRELYLDPSLSLEGQRSHDLESDFLNNQYMIRLGVGLKL